MLVRITRTLSLLSSMSLGSQVHANDLRCIPEVSRLAIQEFDKARANGLVFTRRSDFH